MNFHSFLGCSEGVGAEVRCTFLNPVQCSGFPSYSVREGGLPFPFQAAWATDLHLGQWFACVVFPRYFLNSLDAVFEMVPFMVDRLWRAVSVVFSGRVNISFTHACTIKNSSSDIVFNSSLGHLSGPGACLVLDSIQRTLRFLDW